MRKLPIGVALSGGTARSVAHVGVLKAFVDKGVGIDFVSGTSGGSIIASLYASGMPVSTLEQMALDMSWRKLMSLKLSRLGFISSERIEDFIKELIGDVKFEELKIPCYIVTTELETGEKRVFNSGSVARAVRASCSIPQIYLPVEIDGRNYIDGGFSEYLPIETLQEIGDVFTVGSHLAPVHSNYRRPRHILQLIMQLTGIMAKKNYITSAQKADFLIHPNLDEFSAFDFDSAGKLMEIAFEFAHDSMPEMIKRWKKKGSLLRKMIKVLLPD